jgi:PIN domain nuclease of toxin-antitoxin system
MTGSGCGYEMTEVMRLRAVPASPRLTSPGRLADQGLRPLPVSHAHALAVYDLPLHHRDPFDRLLIAQANLEGMTLITANRVLAKYPTTLLWAGR